MHFFAREYRWNSFNHFWAVVSGCFIILLGCLQKQLLFNLKQGLACDHFFSILVSIGATYWLHRNILLFFWMRSGNSASFTSDDRRQHVVILPLTVLLFFFARLGLILSQFIHPGHFVRLSPLFLAFCLVTAKYVSYLTDVKANKATPCNALHSICDRVSLWLNAKEQGLLLMTLLYCVVALLVPTASCTLEWLQFFSCLGVVSYLVSALSYLCSYVLKQDNLVKSYVYLAVREMFFWGMIGLQQGIFFSAFCYVAFISDAVINFSLAKLTCLLCSKLMPWVMESAGVSSFTSMLSFLGKATMRVVALFFWARYFYMPYLVGYLPFAVWQRKNQDLYYFLWLPDEASRCLKFFKALFLGIRFFLWAGIGVVFFVLYENEKPICDDWNINSELFPGSRATAVANLARSRVFQSELFYYSLLALIAFEIIRLYLIFLLYRREGFGNPNSTGHTHMPQNSAPPLLN